MLSVKPIVYKQYTRNDGVFPVKIRITYQRKSKYIDTPLTATAKQLTRDRDGIKDPRLCSAVCRFADEIRDTLNQNARKIKSVDDAVAIIQGKAERLPSVSDYYRRVVADMEKQNRQHTADNYRTSLARLNEFAPKLQFADITIPFLRQYEQFLANKMGARGVQMYLSCLRRVYNCAIEEFNADGNERIRRSPFTIYHIPEPAPTKKRALTIAQIRYIFDYTPADQGTAFAKDVFLLSFMFCGINTVDLYSLQELTADRLTYNRSKTKGKRKDNAYISIAINPNARPLVERYRHGKRFCFADKYATPYNFNQAVNRGLKRIGASLEIDNLQFYCARHSWATIARNDCNVSMDDVAMALCHAPTTVTDIYIKRDFSRIDRANQRVIEAVLNANNLTQTQTI